MLQGHEKNPLAAEDSEGLFSYVTSHCCPAAVAFFSLFICSMCRPVCCYITLCRLADFGVLLQNSNFIS